MATILASIVGPVFALALIGALLAKSGVLKKERSAGLIAFVVYAALPALLFRSLSNGLPDPQELTLVVAYVVATLAIFFVTNWFARHILNKESTESYLFGMGSAFSNSVMVGVPIVYAVFGEGGIVPLTFIILFNTVILLGGTTILIEVGRSGSGQGSASNASLQTAYGLLRNPVIVGITLGLIWGMFQLPIPVILGKVIDSLSAAVLPCGMVAIGASVIGVARAQTISESSMLSFAKLVLHPLVCFLVARYLFSLSTESQLFITLVAALPLAGNVYALAQQYQTYVDRTATAFVLSTGVSLFTLTVLIAAIGSIISK